nr:hypothetical protein CFP56_30176 [Quercus suber]
MRGRSRTHNNVGETAEGAPASDSREYRASETVGEFIGSMQTDSWNAAAIEMLIPTWADDVSLDPGPRMRRDLHPSALPACLASTNNRGDDRGSRHARGCRYGPLSHGGKRCEAPRPTSDSEGDRQKVAERGWAVSTHGDEHTVAQHCKRDFAQSSAMGLHACDATCALRNACQDECDHVDIASCQADLCGSLTVFHHGGKERTHACLKCGW